MLTLRTRSRACSKKIQVRASSHETIFSAAWFPSVSSRLTQFLGVQRALIWHEILRDIQGKEFQRKQEAEVSCTKANHFNSVACSRHSSTDQTTIHQAESSHSLLSDRLSPIYLFDSAMSLS